MPTIEATVDARGPNFVLRHLVQVSQADKQKLISATESMKQKIKDSFKKDSTHRFYVCKKNDHSILYKMIE